MAWNPSPKVADARAIAAKWGVRQVVILYTTDDGRLGYASYGRDKWLCAEAKRLADAAYGAVEDKLAEGPGE